MQNNRAVGTYREGQAAEWLGRKGYHILDRNFRCSFGEIDLIAEKDGIIVFVEVKYRRGKDCGLPEEAVDRRKQLRISNAAACYLSENHGSFDTPCRFDVAAVSGSDIRLIEDAFPYCGNLV